MLKKISLSAMVFTYLFAGIAHFAKQDYFVSISPRFLLPPLAFVVVGVTGLFEILFSLLLAFPKTRRGACYGIILFWGIALPINLFILYMGGTGIPLPHWELVAMIPFHLLLILWAWWHVSMETKGLRSSVPVKEKLKS